MARSRTFVAMVVAIGLVALAHAAITWPATATLAFSRYFDPAELLVAGDLAVSSVVVLAIASIGLVAASAIAFERTDVAG